MAYETSNGFHKNAGLWSAMKFGSIYLSPSVSAGRHIVFPRMSVLLSTQACKPLLRCFLFNRGVEIVKFSTCPRTGKWP